MKSNTEGLRKKQKNYGKNGLNNFYELTCVPNDFLIAHVGAKNQDEAINKLIAKLRDKANFLRKGYRIDVSPSGMIYLIENKAKAMDEYFIEI